MSGEKKLEKFETYQVIDIEDRVETDLYSTMKQNDREIQLREDVKTLLALVDKYLVPQCPTKK